MELDIEHTGFPGLLVILPHVHEDSRGYFFETWNQADFSAKGLDYQFVQDNQSRSVYGTVRGLHYQLEPYAQAKLVRVFHGEVLDVVLDLRKGSPTFGKHFSIILSATNRKQLLIPRGFAHGFSVLSRVAEFFYKCDNFYSREYERGIAYNDPRLAIDWILPTGEMILSDKDRNLPDFANADMNFQYHG